MSTGTNCYTTKPLVVPDHTQSRVYSALSGKKNNYGRDQALAEEMRKILPGMKDVMLENRRCLERAVTYMAKRGIRQYIDIGCGYPEEPYLHELAKEVMPWARMAYVDHDPVVIVHARQTYRAPGLGVVLADARDIGDV